MTLLEVSNELGMNLAELRLLVEEESLDPFAYGGPVIDEEGNIIS